MKRVKIEWKKLKRNKALGIAYKDEDRIELETRLIGKERLSTLIHELIHIAMPELMEYKVVELEEFLAEYVWEEIEKTWITKKV